MSRPAATPAPARADLHTHRFAGLRAAPIMGLAAAIAILPAPLGGCALQPRSPLPPRIAGAWPFAPTNIRIHPLTRLLPPGDPSELRPAGRPGPAMLVAYVEFLDAWGDTTKAVGSLAVELYRPIREGMGPALQDARWDIDLSDVETNARLFDPATRCYRLPLEGVPAWAIPAAGQPLPVYRLRAILRAGPSGREQLLVGEFLSGA